MLNEFAYCPRLAYLEWVQGEFAHSADTLDGAFQHRRVDQPSGSLPEPSEAGQESEDSPAPKASAKGRGREPPAEPAEPETIHARSVDLSAPLLGMVAKLDLLEGDGVAPDAPLTPVDYKRGAIPDLPERAWEPERVQLCAQGLILRENGYRTEAGVIYYVASKTRVPIAFDDALCARTRELLAQFRETAKAGRVPPPLADSPKCPRCSLVGICLPDETRLLAELAGKADLIPPEEAPVAQASSLPETVARPSAPAVSGETPALRTDEPVRPLIPARADTRPLYVQEQGASLTKKGDTLVVKAPLGIPLAEVRLEELAHVCLFGNVQVTTQALGELFDRQIPVAFFSFGGWFRGLALGLPSKNIELRRRQYAAAGDPAFCLALARRFTMGKLENQRTILRRNAGFVADAVLEQMKEMVRQAANAPDLPRLLGLEGNAARLYFAAFPGLLRPRPLSPGAEPPPFRFDFTTRNRRPPTDPVNALLSYAYSLLTKDLTIACWMAGLDPFLGFYHQPRFGRPALALDLMEEFRPIVGDSVAFTAINTGVVGLEDFIRRGRAVALTPQGRKRFLQAYERRMDTLVTHPVFGYQLSYRRILEVQVRLLTRVLLGELPAYPAFVVR